MQYKAMRQPGNRESGPEGPILLIVDHFENQVFGTFEPKSRVTVLPLGIAPSLYVSRLRPWLEHVRGTVFPVEELSDCAQATMREEYPRFAADIVRRPLDDGCSLLEILSTEEGSLWWFTDTAEKSPLRTPFLNQLYSLLLVREVITREFWGRIAVSMADRALGHCLASGLRDRGFTVDVLPVKRHVGLRGWLLQPSTGRFWIRFFILRAAWTIQTLGNRLVLRAFRIRKEPPGRAPKAVVFSRYPILYANPFTGQPHERNLGDLFAPLRERGVLWQAVLLSCWPWELLRHGAGIRADFQSEQIVPLLLFTTLRESLRAAFGPAILMGLWGWWRHCDTTLALFGSWDVTLLWQTEVTLALTGLELPSNLLLRQAVRRLAKTHTPRVIIHPCEFQPMERAIWAGLAATGTRSVAFQHTTVSSNTLMFFFADGEIAGAVNGSDGLVTPLPDYYLTTGEWPLSIMRMSGFPVERTAVVGAVRYNGLRTHADGDAERARLRSHLGLPQDRPLVLVTTSSDRSDSLALLETLAAAMTQVSASIDFFFKCHYHCRLEVEIRQLFVERWPARCRILDVDADLHMHIRASDVVLLTNSTTGLEAIALGRPPVVFDNRSILNISPLGDLREAALFAYSPSSLSQALQAALDPAVRARLEAAWPAALARTFHRLDGLAPKRFLDFLEEQALL